MPEISNSKLSSFLFFFGPGRNIHPSTQFIIHSIHSMYAPDPIQKTLCVFALEFRFPSSQNLFGPKIARSQKQSLNPRLEPGLRINPLHHRHRLHHQFLPPFFHQDSPDSKRAPTHLMYCTTPNALFDDRQSLFVLPKKPASTPSTHERNQKLSTASSCLVSKPFIRYHYFSLDRTVP